MISADFLQTEQTDEIKYWDFLNPLSPNSDLSQISHCSVKGLSVS